MAGSRITYDRFGRAWVVAYRNPDGSEYGSLLRQPATAASRHQSPGSHHHAHHHAHAARPQLSGPRPAGHHLNAWSGERVDPRDGMADSPLAQALFHSRAGAGQWDASYRLVRNATATYSALVFLAFFAPQILSGSSFALRYSLNQAGAFGPAVNRLFWSGAASGGMLARQYGSRFSGYVGQTLEDVPAGRLAVWAQTRYGQQTDLTREAWDWLSTAFAEGVEGEALYFQGAHSFEGRVWLEIESKILQQRGIPVIKVLNP